MIHFIDQEVASMDINNIDDFAGLFINYLCGERYHKDLNKNDRIFLKYFINHARGNGFSYKQFNELLLLLDRDWVEDDFIKFFFGYEPIYLNNIKKGIIKFRGYAMLCFGNFRFAYKKLISLKMNMIKECLSPYYIETDELIDKYSNQPHTIIDIKSIPGIKTWFTGEVSGSSINAMSKLAQSLSNTKRLPTYRHYDYIIKSLSSMSDEVIKYQDIALNNTDIYLTWEVMDIYFATSMRHPWEFEEVHNFINDVFKFRHLLNLNLRYFNPTQSKCGNPRDKGLIEGLMLKRVKCTIYMAQESDTMGKDSELAATLAQSTPVIAYVPKYTPREYIKKYNKASLLFYYIRLLNLKSDRLFDDPNIMPYLYKWDRNYLKTINNFIDLYEHYRKDLQPFELFPKLDNSFKIKYRHLINKILHFISIAECYRYDKRAKLLRDIHPLAMQVDLSTGVANGVLVVRTPRECADLLYRLLTNTVDFNIKHVKMFNIDSNTYQSLIQLDNIFRKKFKYDKNGKIVLITNRLDKDDLLKINDIHNRKGLPKHISRCLERLLLDGVTVLEEKISGCPYRIITDNENLTNAFWNLWS